MQPYYPTTIREEELKNRVAADFFGSFGFVSGSEKAYRVCHDQVQAIIVVKGEK